MPNSLTHSKTAFLIPKNFFFVFSIIMVLFLSTITQETSAQSAASLHLGKDTVYRYFPEHSPTKATWMSAALPGLGQYYNGKYWKIPIIYAGFSTFAFFVIQNKYEYLRFKEAYAISIEIPDPANSTNPLVANYTSSQLLSQREFYQSNLELSYILTGAFYLLQIIDAAVDANLYDYDVSDDLSIRIEPQLMPTEQGIKVSPGIGIRFKLTKE